MRYLLDTNACIVCLRRKPSSVVARLRALRPDEVAVCTIVRAELLFGAARSRDPVNERALVERFLEPFASLPFDDLPQVTTPRFAMPWSASDSGSARTTLKLRRLLSPRA